MEIVAVEVPHLGNRCHLVHDGRRAIVVDPPRDTRAVEAAAERAQVEITAVADTHIHNDYVSGALGLARRHGADYLLSAGEQVDFERVGVRDGDVVPVGGLEVEVIATPGHTRHHQSFLVRPQQPGPHDTPGALLSGGSLLQGTVGRTDLVDPRLAADLAGMQWASAQVLAGLDPATRLLPTHGFGSFCASTSTCTRVGEIVTLADQHSANPALILDRETFVSELLAGFGPIPRYYRHMAPLNRAGAGRATPRAARPVTAAQVTDAVLGGSWIIDLRSRSAFADGHLAGSVSVEYGTQFATYVGWLVPWNDDIVVLSDTPDLLDAALRDLADIGIDDVATHVVSPGTAARALTASYRRADWATFAVESDTAETTAHPRVVVDVRQRDEWEAGHLPGAIHLPVQDVEVRASELPDGELWVHCRSGYRAGIASSLLHRHGRSVVHIDDAWERVAELELPITTTVAA